MDLAGERALILVVDDEPDVCEVIQGMLTREGFRCTSRPESTAALVFFWARHDRISVAIVDLIMPGLTGLELSRAFLRIDPEVPVILMTAALELPSDAALPANVKKVLFKPILKKDLTTAVRALMEGSTADC